MARPSPQCRFRNLTDAAGKTLTATPGQAVWLPASEGLVTANAESDTADLFVARA